MKDKKIAFYLLPLIAVFSLALLFGHLEGFAAEAEVNINPSIPGSSEATQSNPDPVGIIGNLYQYALLMGGLLAFVIIVFAGIKYSVSGDNASKQSDAKDQIKQALLGLLLLAGAFIVLSTINPDLTTLELPTLEKIRVTQFDLFNPQGEAMEFGGRCINNQCGDGLFCFRDNKCYPNISCNEEDNEEKYGYLWPVQRSVTINDKCIKEYKNLTGRTVTAYCASGFCEEVEDSKYTPNCSDNPSACQSGTSCVSGMCKLNGTEGANCASGNPRCEAGTYCSPTNKCVRETASDIPCGDQIGYCDTGSCIMDRTNIGKYVCSVTETGPDGVCPANETLESCNSSGLAGNSTGGYCHAGSCYSNDTGPYPINP